ncbi:acetylglutamate kinase [Thermoanaerobacterium thermosaccharolyticum]|uniref:acetylglutamate kinase n=1 Tax=Thermoanaerobacterium thermosaccharolyticum TaxID=1517 RepID=UPI0027AAE547|nr:acetylglutamate kinase [Thermoanaerobacterium sp.]WHE07395.1 acetylglutamate kinase [Thermoanaerobacterium thermosaccharolyticum]
MIKRQKYGDEIAKAEILIEALPYIKKFSGATVVIKYGGNAMIDCKIKKMVMQDVVLLKFVGLNPVIVHGGGPDINKMLESLNIESKFINGLRVTDEKTMEVVEMVLTGKINKEIVSMLNEIGGKAIGISGKDGKLLVAEKDTTNGDIGYVGKIEEVNIDVIKMMLDKGYIPVIAPCAVGKDGKTYNVNADTAAGKIAEALKAEKFILLTDVEGILSDVNDKSSVISRIDLDTAKELLTTGQITGGMIPKLKCCIQAVENGVKRAHIIDGRLTHSLLLEIFTDEGIGTMIGKECFDDDNL